MIKYYSNKLLDFFQRLISPEKSEATNEPPNGAIPTFLGIGVAKSGTTTIAEILRTHPEIYIPDVKELHYFDYPEKIQQLGTEGYFRLFEPNKAVGEFTPSYLFVPECRDAIKDALGTDVKFIVSLRNPINRAFSHYCHAVNNWIEPRHLAMGYPREELGFIEAINAEDTRLKSGEYHIRHQSYFSKGLYARQLRHYFAVFPRENFHIIIFEEFVSNPAKHLQDLYQFLGVDQNFVSPKIDIQMNAQTNRDMGRDAQVILSERYAESIKDLEALLNRDLSIWTI